MNATPPEGAAPSPPQNIRAVAVIDIGASAIRMAIAEINDSGKVRTLENLAQEVNLGRDTFTRRAIRKATIEQCVNVLRDYRRKLAEYQINAPDQIRVIATSAVREAENRLDFIDRVYIATGIEVETVEEAEVSRITYLGVQPKLKSEPALAQSPMVITEVGGGTTEVLLVQNEDVLFSRTYRLGSLRLVEMLQAYRAPENRLRDIMKSQIHGVVQQMVEDAEPQGAVQMIALGGDIRFAAADLIPDWQPGKLTPLPLVELEKLAARVLNQTEDELVLKHHVAYADAHTLGPALLMYAEIARGFGLEQVYVTNVNLRDGLLKDMARRGAWTEEFTNQVVRSALTLGEKFGFDEAHARHVAELSRTLFRFLQPDHGLSQRHESILYVAALLHEIGMYVSDRGYHKHSMYLINNSEIFGLGRSDLLLTSLVARYHRRYNPKPYHEGYATLPREARIAVAKLAAILRVAIALDRSYSQRLQEIRCERKDGQLVISIPRVNDLALEQLALKQLGALFEDIYGMAIVLRRALR
jgi:exopolyphosphatase/guanosine-5'-triphosphate,3'-diphosphate pyrophosphatase